MEIVREFISTVFIAKDGKVLLTWNKKCSIWVPIGGHIERNELPCDSVIREAKEETGLDIEIFSIKKGKSANIAQPAQINLDHVREDHKHINLMYFATVKGGQQTEKTDDGMELRWFSREDLEKENLMPNIKEWALEAIRQIGL